MSLLGDIGRVLRGEITADARKLIYGRVENVVGWESYDPQSVRPGTAYMQWYLQEMWLRRERDWLNHYYPLVYSVTSIQFGSTELSLPRTLGEFAFGQGEDFSNLSDALRLNYPMTAPLPYNGGAVEIAAALVGVRNQDGLAQLVAAVGQLATTLAVPQLSAVASFAGPVANTIDTVMGQGSQRFALGLHQLFKSGGEEELREGYYLCGDYDEPFDFNYVKVKGGRLVRADNEAPVRDFNYMLFRLEVNESRDDLEGLTVIFDLVKEAQKAAVAPDGMAQANSLIRDAMRTAWESTDLTIADRNRVALKIKDQFNDYLKLMGIAGEGAAVDESDLRRPIADRVRDIAPHDAIAIADADMRRKIFGGDESDDPDE